MVICEMKREMFAPLKARKSGKYGPEKTYTIKTVAIVGRAGPITRRVASSNKMISKKPKIKSRVMGSPAREAIPV